MNDDDFISGVQFYKASPSVCPYLPNKTETKVLTWLLQENEPERLYDVLLEIGFRRSQTVMYRPVCEGCRACTPLRVPVYKFRPSRTQKRIISYNQDIYRHISSPSLTQEHYELYQKYMKSRHQGGEMEKMSFQDVSMMVEESNVDTILVEYYHEIAGGEKLVGWVLSDMSRHGISMVYSVYDPDGSHRSLGNHAVLDHVELCKELGFPYLYLGYWIKDSEKMAYKIAFKPYELFLEGRWQSEK